MPKDRRPARAKTPHPPGSPPAPPASLGPLAVPLGLIVALVALTALPRIHDNQSLLRSFWIAGGVLTAWLAWLAVRAGRAGLPGFVHVPPRAQHYIQMCCHLSVYAYWGYYWAPVYPFAPLLVGQLFFAYAFDMLLSWTRRQPYGLGFGPFPIVLSTNLFLWFKDDWFLFQFLLIAVGFLGKAFVRWERDGKRVHIFNPSAFTLALFSLVLIVTGTTDVTWAQEINTTFSLGPRMYTVLFLIGLVVMYCFAITPVTAMAAATLFGLSALYSMLTGVPYFVDSEIPTAVFLGLHLLVTDPSTSPRTPLGRAIFGVLYGLGVFGLVRAAHRAGRADLLRQAALRADPQPDGAGDRSAGGRRRLAIDRPLARARSADRPPQPGAHGGVDRCSSG